MPSTAAAQQARNYAVASVFLVGLCIGVIISERVYIQKGGHVPKPRFLQTRLDSAQHAITLGRAGGPAKAGADAATATAATTAAGATNSLTSYPDSKPPRNDLEAMLRKIAPKKEVSERRWEGSHPGTPYPAHAFVHALTPDVPVLL